LSKFNTNKTLKYYYILLWEVMVIYIETWGLSNMENKEKSENFVERKKCAKIKELDV